jgi:hypothetical protein
MKKKDVNLKSPLPVLFPINKEDKNTWPWLDCEYYETKKSFTIKWVKNPNFKYGHLIPGY